MKICRKCGKGYDDTWKVCLHCGAPLGDDIEIRLARLENQAKDMLAEIDAIRRGAPPPERAAEEKRDPAASGSREDTETRIGKYLLNKIGIISIVAGVSFFLAYAFRYLTPLLKIGIGYIISAAMAASGVMTGRIEKFRWYGRGLICGGWVLAYFTTYAMYHIKATRIIESQLTDLVLVAVVVVAMLAHMARYRSQGLVILAMLLGYVTAGISRDMIFSLLYITVLAAVSGALLVTMKWQTVASFSLLGTYLTHLLLTQPGRTTPPAGIEFWVSAGFLTAYWSIYNAVGLLVKVDDEREDRISGAFILTNALLFGLICYFQVKSYHPSWRAGFALSSAGMMLALGALSGLIKGRVAAKSAFIVSAIAFASLSFRFTLGKAQSCFIWLWEIPALLLAGLYFRSVFYRFAAWALSVIMLLGAFVSFGVSGEMVAYRGGEIPVSLLLFLTAAVSFYIARYLYVTMPAPPDCREAETRFSGLYAIAATVALLGVSYYEVRANLVTLVWSAAALFLFIVGFLARDRVFRYSAIGVVAVSLLRGVTVDLAGINTAYRIVLFMCLGVVLLGVSFWYARTAGASRDEKADGGLAMRIAALFVIPLAALLILAAACRYPSGCRDEGKLAAKEVEITARFIAGKAITSDETAFLRERKFRNLEKTLLALPLSKRSDQADIYVRAIAIGMESHDIYLNLGRYYSQNDKKDKALEMYEKAISLDPKMKQWGTRNIVRLVARLYKDIADYRKAVLYYEKSLSFNKNIEDLYELAVCYKNLGEIDKALEKLNEAVRLDQRGAYSGELESLRRELYAKDNAPEEKKRAGLRDNRS